MALLREGETYTKASMVALKEKAGLTKAFLVAL